MSTTWRTFLEQAGYVANADAGYFADPERELRAALDGDVLCALSGHGLIRAEGADAVSFLQGQLTNDVRRVTPEHSQLSGYCTPKGRLLACFRLFQRGEGYFLRLPRERVEALLKRLRLYVLRAKVTFADASDEEVALGLAGPRASDWLRSVLGDAPAAVDAVVQSEGLTVIRVPSADGHVRFELYGEAPACQRLWTEWAGRGTYAGPAAWRLLDIEAGIPTIYDATAEAFVPQMANLQLLQGINFQKGCYTGQEIVARTRYLGKAKRRMYRARVQSEPAPAPGDAVFSATLGEIGKIADACRHPEGGHEVLAVAMIDGVEAGAVCLRDAQGPTLDILPLPYPFEETAA
ncbi:MAG: folate-binding protein YgfZ [Gammaproteobacteria bacterium]|nr:folate-binding protein YgfZ [Gammaproteobacteria bacterium]MCP5423506.1 folate-binding protein YgfZ [Gammaproteobacteria bacterium]